MTKIDNLILAQLFHKRFSSFVPVSEILTGLGVLIYESP